MFRSLRFRLAAIFLAGIALAGLVSTVIAVRLFEDYNRDRTYAELRREADGLSKLFARLANERTTLSSQHLERATGDRLFYVGVPLLLGEAARVQRLSKRQVDWPGIQRGRVIEFEFTPPRQNGRFLAVAHPVKVGAQTFGALVVASPKDELQSRMLTLLERLALAFAAGLLVAGALVLYLSRRLTRPVLALSRAADEIAEGRYDVALPKARGDEIGQLATRFEGMATRLREAEELERNFLMSVSHELRTPLTAIRGHLEALRDGLISDEAMREQSLDVLLNETARLERLVGDILDLAKLETRRFTVRREEVDMGRLVDHAYAGFSEEARRRGIRYRHETDGRPVILSDGDRVLQIVSNLLANAFRWTPDGGSVDLSLAAGDGSLSVEVGDTGPGIDPDERERIFRPFWSGDGGGTGLGLAIANELAVALGGRIELESEPGAGSRFRLVLPVN